MFCTQGTTKVPFVGDAREDTRNKGDDGQGIWASPAGGRPGLSHGARGGNGGNEHEVSDCSGMDGQTKKGGREKTGSAYRGSRRQSIPLNEFRAHKKGVGDGGNRRKGQEGVQELHRTPS